MFVTNDPYYGGVTHLNDHILMMPVFVDGKLLAWTANIAHWNDVGGLVPGSMSSDAVEIFQEGVRIPPTRIATGGILSNEIMELLYANMRVPNERRGDFSTMIGASRKAGEHVRKLVRR